MNTEKIVSSALEQGGGVLRLAPNWVPRDFCIPGRRIKLHPDDYYGMGAERGGLDERWFASTVKADNGPLTRPNEGLSYIVFRDGSDTKKVLLKDAIEAMVRPEVKAGILDSIGAFFTVVEAGKNLGERTMGQRAKTIADASRWLMAGLRVVEDPKLFIYINHTQPNIGGRGFVTPGGETKTYLANTRVWIRVVDSDRPTATGNFLAEAKVQKLKHGGTHAERKGWIYFIPGHGVARGVTAVFDCSKFGLADLGAVVRLDGESHGRMRQLVDAELNGEHEVFEPFHEALRGLDDGI